MTRSIFLLLAIVFTTQVAAIANEAVRPNFILMIADDMAADDCGAMGHPHIQTPNLDRLAAEGLVFEQAFLTCSSCSPSRASVITCKYPHQTDAEQLHWPVPANQTTFVELLHQAGYYTAASGKWHLGNEAKKGFDLVQEPSAWNQESSIQSILGSGSSVVADPKNASGCMGWVETLEGVPKDQPFFLWLAAQDPHRPYEEGIIRDPHHSDDTVIPPFVPDTLDVRKDFAHYYDEIARLDSYVGAVVEQLKASGRDSNTYIIFISDNGRPFPRCKTTVFDSGIQTPLFVRLPEGKSAGKRTRALVSSIDIGATVLDLASVPADSFMMGKSFQRVLNDPSQNHREEIFAEHNWHDYDAYQRAVRSTRFKYIRNYDSDLRLTPPADAVRSDTYRAMQSLNQAGKLPPDQRQCFTVPRASEEFYDLANDPSELNNLALDPAYADVLSKYRDSLDAWRLDTNDAATTQRSADEFDRESGEPLKNLANRRLGKEDGFRPMFEDANLAGWKRISTHDSTWAFEDGVLKCTGKPIGELRTDRMYQNFILDLEWRHLVPKGNAGVFVWADDITARGVPFHRGIEVQVLENAYGNNQSHTTHGDIFPIHGATMVPLNGRGGGRAFPTESRSSPAPQWNHYRIVCNDGEISLAVNGKFVTRGTHCLPKKGYICLESEGGVVEYRNVRIKELPATPVQASETAIFDRGYRCLYLGIDLEGWHASGVTNDTGEEPTNWVPNDWTLSHRPAGSARLVGLQTVERFERAEFIVDVKRLSPNDRFEISFGDHAFSSESPAIQSSLGEAGNWSRLEIFQRDAKIGLRVNGVEVNETIVASTNAKPFPLALQATGDVDFSNIYVRQP